MLEEIGGSTEPLLGTGEPELGVASELELTAITGQDATICPNTRHASTGNSRQSPSPKSQSTETLCEEPPEETPCTAEDEPPTEDKLLTEEELPAEDNLTSEEELSAFFKTSSADSMSDVQEKVNAIASTMLAANANFETVLLILNSFLLRVRVNWGALKTIQTLPAICRRVDTLLEPFLQLARRL